MNTVTANPLLGIALHAIGAMFAATCYTPQKKSARLVVAILLARASVFLLAAAANHWRVADDS